VLAAGPGNVPTVRFLAGGLVRLGSRPSQKTNTLGIGGVATGTGHKLSGFWTGWNRTAVRFYGSFHFGSTLAPFKYLSSDCIVI